MDARGKRLAAFRNSVIALVIVLVIVGTPGQASAELAPSWVCHWMATDLPVPEGFSDSVVTGTDGAARFVGTVERGDPERGMEREAVLWEDGRVRLLGPALGQPVRPAEVNSSGVVVGTTANRHAVRYQAGRAEALPELADWTFSEAVAVNDAGDVVGIGGVVDEDRDIVFWPASRPGTVQVIPVPEHGYREPRDLDEQGRVAGVAVSRDVPSGRVRGYLWSPDGSRRELSQGGAQASSSGSTDVQRMRGGRIVGAVDGAVVEWDLSGRIVRRLPDRIGSPQLNRAGTVVGTRHTGGQSEVGLWKEGALAASLPQRSRFTVLGVVGVSEDEVVTGNTRLANPPRSRAMQWRC